MGAARLMKFLLKCLPRTFFGCIPGVSTDDPLVILRSLLDPSEWLLAYCIKLVSIDLKKDYDLISHRDIQEAMRACGLISRKFSRLLWNSLNWRYFVVGLRGAKNPATHSQGNGLGTGAPESPAIFIMTFAWFLIAMRKYERIHIPRAILEEEEKLLPAREVGFMDLSLIHI